MWLKTSLSIGLGCLYINLVYAKHNPLDFITIQKLQAHVAFLTSDMLEGRMTGSYGEKLAMDYTAKFFQQLGLEPAGDNGTFFQKFEFSAGSILGSHNSFVITKRNGVQKNLTLNKDWRPLSFSNNTIFEATELVFVGYGITAPAFEKLPRYNSYHRLNVKNKWVIVFTGLPDKINKSQLRQMEPYSSLRYKAYLAKVNGAKGIIFVNGPNSQARNGLISPASNQSLTHAGLVAISIKETVINEWLKKNREFTRFNKQKKNMNAEVPIKIDGIKIHGQIDIQRKKRVAYNVLAKMKMNQANDSVLVVGAHADHLGLGKFNHAQSQGGSKYIYSGADDNASGVSCVLEVAAKLNSIKASLRGNKTILFAIWSGEELGLLGSSHFIEKYTEQKKTNASIPPIVAYINLDMVGRLRNNLVIQGLGSSQHWSALIKQITQKPFIPLIMQNDPYLPTDSTSFYLHKIPTLNFFTGAHSEYHTSRDTLERLNFEGMKKISIFLSKLILEFEASPNKISYQAIEKSRNRLTRRFRVYLGTIPDYASADLTGVKLAGVTRNSPAERAGLRQNDVIVELAGKQIHDIYDYTYVMNTLPPGKSAALVALRGQTKVPLTVLPERRD